MRIVVHTADVAGERMAGPGIRAWYLARELSKIAPVALVAQIDGRTEPAPFAVFGRGTPEADEALREADILIGQPKRGFFRRRRGQKIVYDLFDPVVLELRELYGHHPSLRQRIHIAAEWGRLAFALRHGDLLVCATRSQRLFYDSLRGGESPWVEVPFGIDPEEISPCPKPQDDLVLWGGGVWEWLDPKTAVDAVVRLNREGLRCRLLFLGRSRPNRDLVDRRREDRFSRLLAAGSPYVAANEGWVPYRERLSWLRASKIAMMLHRPTAEAEHSIRTRLFDAIAAGVPVVTTEKGFAAELVRREGLGIVVPPEDAEAVAAAIRTLLTDDAFHARCVTNLERIRPQFAWDLVARPLVETVKQWL